MLAIGYIACHSQECPYKFMGIPIEGTLDEFAKKLEQKGFEKHYFTPIESDRAYGMYNYYFTGKFFGRNDLILGLFSGSAHSKIIVGVSVSFPSDIGLYRDIRSALEKQYSDTTKWILDYGNDSGTLANYEITNALQNGAAFQFGIIGYENNYFYIALALDKNVTRIIYRNPIQMEKTESVKNEKRMQDL